MNKREFLKLSTAFGVSMMAPNLMAKQSMSLYGAPALPSVTMAIAALQGKSSKTHDITFKTWKNPDQLRAGVANGLINATMAPLNVGINLLNQGFDFKLLNILAFGVLCVMSKDESIKNIADLKGKKIILPFKNDTPDIIFRAIIKKLELNESEYELTYVQSPPEVLGLFLQKEYDAAIMLEPLASVCELRAKKIGLSVKRAFWIHDEYARAFNKPAIIPQAGIIIQSKFYEQNKEFFDIYESDLKAALNFINSNPQSAAEIGSNYLPTPSKALVNSFKISKLAATRASELGDEIFDFINMIYEFNPKLIGGKIPPKSYLL
ncbi:ABC transporter substrate-binding protein [Campylobacter majalis]|uniref:ABC transporter substrate-binding protein n=1 Tax=Campylobacter majalis TaxID=2790656 RepID=UPI003D688D09